MSHTGHARHVYDARVGLPLRRPHTSDILGLRSNMGAVGVRSYNPTFLAAATVASVSGRMARGGGVSATNTPKGPGFPERLLGAILTSLLGLCLLFVSVPLLAFALPSQIPESLGTIAMYAFSLALSGVVCLALNRFWLSRTWAAIADTMIGPYILVGGVPLAFGAMYLGLSKNPNGFVLNLYVLPALGAIGPVSVAAVVCLGSRVLRWRGAPPISRRGTP